MPRAKPRTLAEAAAAAEAALKEKDRLREEAYREGREIQRAASAFLRGGAPASAADAARARTHLASASARSRALRERLAGHDDLYESGMLETPLQELAEAHILLAHARGSAIPTYGEIEVTPAAFLLGMGDAIGEFRRQLIDALRRGRIADAEAHLAAMEEAFAAISLIALPDAIVPLRKKVDTARALLERSASEVALAARLDEHAKAIASATGRRARR
jgi:translin